MQLSHIALVNWHLFDAEDIRIFGDTGIIGENRSGKSTLLDMISVVFNGASGRQKLNLSASETGERAGGRSIHAYCLGRLGEGDATLRPEAQTYISLTFSDPVSERRPVTIGLALWATRSESHERVRGRFIVDGAELTTTDYLTTDAAGNREPKSWDQVRERLEEGEKAGEIRFYNHWDNARNYIREYMRLLMTGGRYNDEKRFIRSFTNAIAFEHMKSTTAFVRELILEQKDIKIGQLRESISAYRSASEIIKKLTRRCEALREIDGEISLYADALAERDRMRWVGKRAVYLNAEEKLAARLTEKRRAEMARAAAGEEAQRIEEEIGRLGEKLRGVEETIAATGIKDKQATLEERKRRLHTEREALTRQIAAAATRLERLVDLLNIKEELAGHDEAVAALEELRGDLTRTPRVDWPRDPGSADRRITNLLPLMEALATHLDAARSSLLAELEQLRQEGTEIAAQMAKFSRGERVLSPNTEAMCDRLRREGMQPKVLCEFLDMKDESWRAAAEAMLNRDREAIIVDKSVVDKAILIRRREKVDFHGVRIVNTRKLDQGGTTIEPGTLASVISAADPIAIAFVNRRVGRIRLAYSQADLHAPGRAVMQDGTYDDGLVVETREVPDRKIGAKASDMMRQRLEQRLRAVRARAAELERQTGFLREAVKRIDDARSHFADADPLSAVVSKLSDVFDDMEEADRQLAALSAIVDQSLYEEKRGLELKIANLRLERITQEREEASQAANLRNVESQLAEGFNSEGSIAHRNATRDSYRRIRKELPYASARHVYRERLSKNRTHQALASWAKAAETRAEERFKAHELKTRELLTNFFIEMGERSLFSLETPLLSEVRPYVQQEIAFIEGNQLIQYSDAAAKAAERASGMLRNSFVAELRDRIDSVRREINDLNESLRPYPFHHERYSFHSQFDQTYGIVQQLLPLSDVDDETLSTIFSADVPENHVHAQAFAAVKMILTDETFDFQDLEDYRRFFTFHLVMEDVTTGRKTQWETRRRSGSGAEQQAPFYVAIGAALASVYHGRARTTARSKLGLGLAVFDEAFYKMDTNNQRQMLDFYRNLGLQTIVASPMINRGIIYENMHSVVEVYRIGDQAETDRRVIKDRTRREMRAINPDNMTPDELIKAAAE